MPQWNKDADGPADHAVVDPALSIRAAVWRGPEQHTVEARPQPTCPPGWLLISPERVGLCGTDFSIASGRHSRATAPLVLGHEFVGTVASAHPAAPPPGTRVAVNPLLPCGSCWPCRNDLSHTCRNLRLIGIDLDGALAELVAVPATNLVPVQPSTAVSEAALTEPLAVALHAVRRADVAEGQTALVIGAGPIGILIALVAVSAGCRVLISEPHPVRRTLAAELGLETLDADADPVAALEAVTGSTLSDVVFDCAGVPSVAAQLSALARVRGTIVLAGLYGAPAAVDLHAVTFAEQQILGSRVYGNADFRDALALIEAGTLELSRLAVETFPLPAIEEAFQAARRGETLKVLVSPQPDLS
jgi:2-desacetyl-2-hydroxyethyl bacteriochlorophyllide A dehydrogenase